MLKSNNTKTKLEVLNSISLQDAKDLAEKGKGQHFVSRFIEPGIAEYKDTFGKILITKETLDKFIQTIIGAPVIIKHKDIDSSNVDKERVGVVSEVWYDANDGWYYCSGVLFNTQAIDLVRNQGWSVSCTYDFETDNKPGTYHGLDYNMQFTNGEFLHLALVPNPRYERANIVMNSKDEKEEKQPENIKDTVLDAISEVVTNCLGELRAENKKDFNEADVNRDKWGRFAEKGGNFPHNVDLNTIEAISFSWDEYNTYQDKEKVENYYNNHIKGHTITHKDNKIGKIRFVDLGLDETEYQNRKRNLYILTKIPQIIEKSEYDRTESPKHPHKNIKQFHILYGKIKLPSKEQALVINIAEDNQGNKYYYYKPIQTIKIKEPRN